MKYLFGLIFIVLGIIWFVVTLFATGMLSRPTTARENLVPFGGLVLILFGIVIMIWG